MTDQTPKLDSGRPPRRGRFLVASGAAMALSVVAVLGVPSTLSSGATQPVRTGPTAQLDDSILDQPHEEGLEQSAVVVQVGGDNKLKADFSKFGSKSSDKQNRSSQRSKGQQSETRQQDRAAKNLDESGNEESATAAVSTAPPTDAPAISSDGDGSTTSSAATAAPATAAPTTAGPITTGPTTAAPTTVASTIVASTAVASTTVASTTVAPNMKPTSTPAAPIEPSSAVINVSFDNYSANVPYNTEKQEQDGMDIRWNRHWSDRSVIANNESKVGDNSVRITYPAGHRGGAYAVWELPPRQEYYVSYYVMFADGFDFDGPKYSGGKLPGLASGDLCSGGSSCDGTNGFTARYMWRDGGQAQLYLYDMDRSTGWGREVYFEVAGQDVYFEPGKWHHLVQRIRTNTLGKSDGLVQVWMDGDQVVNLDRLRFRTNDDLIDVFYFSTFFGGSNNDWYPTHDSYAYFDQIIVSPSRSDVGL